MWVRVRDAGPQDAIRLAQFGAQAFVDSFAADNTPENMAQYLAGAFSAEKQARELADPAVRYIVAEAGAAFVGSARLGFGAAPAVIRARRPVEIARFYAARNYIGKGIGRALMEYCLQSAAQRRCDVLWLGVWERNTSAIAFYEKWGFTIAGTIGFQLGEDAQTDRLMVRAVPTAET
jgi:ribosomal protein S18 acetylase RimI-like enzyme